MEGNEATERKMFTKAETWEKKEKLVNTDKGSGKESRALTSETPRTQKYSIKQRQEKTAQRKSY